MAIQWGKRLFTVSVLIPTAVFCLLHELLSRLLILLFCVVALAEYHNVVVASVLAHIPAGLPSPTAGQTVAPAVEHSADQGAPAVAASPTLRARRRPSASSLDSLTPLPPPSPAPATPATPFYRRVGWVAAVAVLVVAAVSDSPDTTTSAVQWASVVLSTHHVLRHLGPVSDHPAHALGPRVLVLWLLDIAGLVVLAWPWTFALHLRTLSLSLGDAASAHATAAAAAASLPASFLTLHPALPVLSAGAARQIVLALSVWNADNGALVGGALVGGAKAIPRVSPGKTVAGVVAGVLSCAATLAAGFVAQSAGYLPAGTLPHATPFWLIVLFGLFLGALAVLGDLLESMMKRAAGVKDSGALLPGQGGLLDRMDSLLLAVPVAVHVLPRLPAIARALTGA